MLYTGLPFWFLTTVTFLIYYALPRRGQNILLIMTSLLFYTTGDVKGVPFLILSAILDYIAGAKAGDTNLSLRHRRLWVVFSITLNLLFLGYMKYFNFFLDQMLWLERFNFQPEALKHSWGLPLGISFYTFQTIGYTVDCYKQKVKPCKSLTEYMLFVTFYPQLVAGPIESARTLLPQFFRQRFWNPDHFREGIHLIALGLFKKMYVADSLASPIHYFAQYPHTTGPQYWVAGWLMGLRVYFDFSAYSDIARGLGLIFGIKIIQNFKPIWLAHNTTKFWGCWNISLTRWFRNYLAIPMGASSPHLWRSIPIILLSFSMIGLWHGASWNWIYWGLFHGIVISLYRILRKACPQIINLTPIFVGWIFIHFFYIPASGLLHLMENPSVQSGFLQRAGTGWNDWTWMFDLAYFIVLFIFPIWIIEAVQLWKDDFNFFSKTKWYYQTLAITFFLVMAIYFGIGADGTPFIYFQF